MDIRDGLKQIIQSAIADGAFPGATYAVVTKDKVYMGCLGNRALMPEVEINTIDTIYDMASLSKVVSTTSCMMKLVEEGRVRLFAKVAKYIPEFRHAEVTIWDLLTHTSGLPEGIERSQDLRTKEEAWGKIFAKDLVYPKNSKIVYSDIGYMLLGTIIERITEMSLAEYAQKVIFEPLKMTDTQYCPKDKMRCAPTEERHDPIYRGMVRGDVHDEAAYVMGGIAGHAGLFSTVRDVTHFMQMMLNNGVYQGKNVFQSQTVKSLFIPQVSAQVGVIAQHEVRSLGWWMPGYASSAGELISRQTILHTGFTGTNLWIDAENEIGFCMLTNRVHPTRNNSKHLDVRAMAANYVMAHLEAWKDGTIHD